MQTQPHNPHDGQTGLSLIELMIAVLVGVVLIAGVLSIFISSRKSYGINTAVARVQDNGRFALDFIRTATRKAGYMGCAGNMALITPLNNQLIAPASTTLPYNFAQALTGFEFTGGGGTAPTNTYVIAAENPATTTAGWTPPHDPTLPAMIPGSDVLVIRYSLGGDNPIYVSPTGGTAGTLSINGGLVPADIIVVSNCVQSAIYQATNITGAGTTLVVDPAGGTTPGDASVIPATDSNWQVAKAITQVFYIGQGADGSPALFEATTQNSGGFASQELVAGVENMQILYGVDFTGSQIPSQYQTADVVNGAATWNAVVSVRIALLMRSDLGAVTMPATATTYNLLGTVIQAPQDTRLRQVFTATIGLRNRLP